MKDDPMILVLCGINFLVFLGFSLLRLIEIINPFSTSDTVLYEVAFLLLCAFLPFVVVIIVSQRKR